MANDTAKALEVTSHLLEGLGMASGFLANKARTEAVSAVLSHKGDCPTTRMLLNRRAKEVRMVANYALAKVEGICPGMEPWELTP